MDLITPTHQGTLIGERHFSIKLRKRSYQRFPVVIAFFLFAYLFSCASYSQVLINEVITDPEQDWSSGGFNDPAPGGTPGSDDEWIELYISSNGLDLTGWTIEVIDTSPFSGDLTSTGAFDVSNYIGTGSFANTAIGDYLILGNPDGGGAINNTVTVILRDNTSTIIDQVEIASGSGTMFTGTASSVDDESVCRIPNGQDTDVEVDDFVKTRATLGTTNSPSGTVLINEVVTTPRTDWSSNNFDGTDGGSTISNVDEWIELYIGTSGLNLTKWTLSITDSDGTFSGDLTSTGAFDVVNYIGSGNFTSTVAGDYLVLGNPDGANDLNEDVYITLSHPDGTLIDDVEIGDNEEGDAIDDGAPNSTGSSVEDESIARVANAVDTDVDATDFSRVISTLGTENGRSIVFVDASAIDDDGIGSMADPKQLIQSGVDLVISGGTVNVIGGSYSQSISISKSLTLNGANQGVAGSGTRGTESAIDVSGIGINISSDNVTVDGFQLGTDASTSSITNAIVATGSNISVVNNVVYANSLGISVAGASSGTVAISNNVVSMLAIEDATNLTNGSVGISLSSISGSADADLLNNNISNAGTGVFAYALTSSVDAVIDGGAITGSTTGIFPTNTNFAGGFSPTTVTVQNVTMSGFSNDADVGGTETGVYAFVTTSADTNDDLVVTMDNLDISGTGNTASNYAGIVIGDFPSATDGISIDATITNCNIHDNSNRGIHTRGADATTNITQTLIMGNGFDPTATGGNPGFSVISREGSVTTVSNCLITNPATLSGVEDIPGNYYTAGLHIFSGGSLTVSNSSLDNNGNGFIAETSNINLSGNHFGTTDEATILARVGSSNDFTPWITSGTDSDGSTPGFQPDLSSVIVGTGGTQTSGDRIQEGHDLVDANGTLTLLTSDYNETLTVSKNVTLSPEANTTIDNVTLNGGNLTVLSSLEINSTLTLTNGILDIDLDDGDKSDDPTLTLNGAVAGTFSDNNHIEGRVQQEVTGGGSYTFPVGDEGAYRPAVLDPTNTTTFSVIHIDGTTPGDIETDLVGTPSAELLGNIESTLNNRYWDIDIVSGVPGNTDVELQISGSDAATDPTTLGMTRFDGANWSETTLITAGGSNPFNVIGRTANFSEFTIYSTDNSTNPLPVELIDFKGIYAWDGIMLSWSTVSEVNADYFLIERRKLHETSFVDVGTVAAHGNTNERIDYRYQDNGVGGAVYYRLKMVDYDGTFEYSETVLVAPELSQQAVVFYPNPTKEYILLEGVDPSFIKQVEVYDLHGRVQKTTTKNASQVSLSQLPDGQYLLRIELIEGSVYEGRIIKQN